MCKEDQPSHTGSANNKGRYDRNVQDHHGMTGH